MFQMLRTKKAFFAFLFVLSLNVGLYLVFRPFPTIQKFVDQTNIKISYIRTLHLKELEIDQSHLEYLGFFDHPPTFLPRAAFNSVVIGSAVSSHDYTDSYALIDASRLVLPDFAIVLFDIGLRSWDANQLKKRCNVTTNCRIRGFEFDKFPSHIGNTRTKAYKPLAIQMLLRDQQGVVWIDLSAPPFVPARTTSWSALLLRAANVGLQAWPIPWPTSSLTHPRMFDYLKSHQQDYYFHRMISTRQMAIFSTELIRTKVMLSWVKCALSEPCIAPLGSINVGCNYHRQPFFRFSGCHWYEMSALNVILGQAFQFNTTGYMTWTRLFVPAGANETNYGGMGEPTPAYTGDLPPLSLPDWDSLGFTR